MTADATLVAVLERHASTTPDRPAVTDEGRTVTYRELADLVQRAARQIVDAGGSPGTPVGVLLPPGIDSVATIYGVMRAGAIALPLDPEAPPVQIAEIVDHAGASLVVSDEVGCERVDGAASTITLDPSRAGAATLPDIGPDDLAALYYTSGSTGRPKGFVVTHGAQLDGVRSWSKLYRLEAGDRVALLFHPSFGASRVSLFGALFAGAELQVYDARRVGPVGIATAFERDGLTFAHAGASLLRSVLDQLPRGSECPSLRIVAVGAESLHRRDVARFRHRFSSGCTLAYTYAVSETGPVTALLVTADTELTEDLLPVGRPLPGKQVTIAAPDPAGVGELVVSGTGIACGYWRDETLSAERFTVTPDGQPQFRTGDRGRLGPDGTLEYRGRVDTRVKVRGFGVDLVDVEHAVRSVAPVEDVVAVVDQADRPRLVAYVVPASGTRFDIQPVRTKLAARLPAHMIPAVFVVLHALPRTPRGKVDRAALPPVPTDRPDLDHVYVAPRDDVERAIATVWESVLDIHPVGIYDDFTALGGDSLAVVEAVTGIETTLARQVPPAAFIEFPTVAGLAELLRTQGEQQFASPLVALRLDGSRPPLFCVHGAGGEVLNYQKLAARLSDDQPVFGFQPRGTGVRKAQSSVEKLAVLYVDELRRAHPEGPFVLGGYSFGGTVAFEMACLLAAEGRPPALLVMFDTSSPAFMRRRVALHPVRRVLRRAQLDAMWLGWKLGLPSWRILRRLVPSARTAEWEWRKRMSQRGVRRYRPGVYSASSVLFFRTAREPGDPELGWQPSITSAVEIAPTAGTHMTVLDPPHVDAVAERLDAALAELAGGEVSPPNPTLLPRG